MTMPGALRDNVNEIEYYRGVWERKMSPRIVHSQGIWNERAGEWIQDLGSDGTGKPTTLVRVEAAASYLRSRGLLGAKSVVCDVGCGPGLFVMEFARTAKRATGIDYSERFIAYATELARKRGVANVSFECRDFIAIDIDGSGLEGAFDLVFTSITPAASGKGCLDKIMRMSRAFCFNTSFVHVDDSLAKRAAREVFNEEYAPRWNGNGFYALVNLLWLSGYYPETSYRDERREEILRVDESLAAECGRVIRRDRGDDVARIFEWLRRSGEEVKRDSLYRYGSVLWDVRRKDPR
jgi:SAM-dependent methyltransferase